MKFKQFESTVHKQRFLLGVICGLLPILCTLFGFISCNLGGDSWRLIYSISETYYTHHKAIMIISLGLSAFFLFTYEGYDLGDRILTVLAGAGSLGVAVFPCESIVSNAREGLFSLPIDLSNILHFISALLVFGSFTVMTFTQFPKGNCKSRNIVYRVCGIIMGVALLLVPVKIVFHWAGYWMMILEFIMLEAFAVAWIVKSRAAIIFSTRNSSILDL